MGHCSGNLRLMSRVRAEQSNEIDPSAELFEEYTMPICDYETTQKIVSPEEDCKIIRGKQNQKIIQITMSIRNT